ncbi:hypothetical protein, partial [Flavobacterium sp.]
LTGEIEIAYFYLLKICSTSSGHGPEFHLGEDRYYYFLLKKNNDGKYGIPTPTSGFDEVRDSKVNATFRHTYHQLLVSDTVYEMTMSAIFANYHGKEYAEKPIRDYISKYLSMKPAGFEKEEIDTFYAQHVALETAFHLQIVGYYESIVPFLNDSGNFHNQISAARALTPYNTDECKKALLKIIADSESSDFSKVMCIRTLRRFKPKKLKSELKKLAKTASDERTGFGGNIMDPRICTYIPSVKSTLTELVEYL